MATTKKTTAAPARKSAKAPAATRTMPAKSAEELRAAAALEAATAHARASALAQMKQWEEAVKLFSQKKFAPAKARFTEAASGPAAHIADKARSYAQICARKTNGDG